MNAQGLAERTKEERIRIVTAFSQFLGRSCSDATPVEINRWISSKPHPTTRWSYFTQLRAFYRWLSITKLINDNPCDVLPSPKRPKSKPRPVATVHVAQVLARPLRTRTRIYILLAAFAGLRVHEIAKINGRDYDPEVGLLQVTGKGGNTHSIPIHEGLRPELDALPRTNWWFPSPTGRGPVTSRAVGSTIIKAFRQINVQMQAHQLRHTFATELLRSGVDIRVVQLLMRHESIQTTAIYVQVLQDEQRTAVNKLRLPMGHTWTPPLF